MTDNCTGEQMAGYWQQTGELVAKLCQHGELRVTHTDKIYGEPGYYVTFSDEAAMVSQWSPSLLDALEKVDHDYGLIANYG